MIMFRQYISYCASSIDGYLGNSTKMNIIAEENRLSVVT